MEMLIFILGEPANLFGGRSPSCFSFQTFFAEKQPKE